MEEEALNQQIPELYASLQKRISQYDMYLVTIPLQELLEKNKNYKDRWKTQALVALKKQWDRMAED
jgi:hypothetical protein